MANAKAWLENGSILKAIDGSNLSWDAFREEVLQPYNIRVANPDESVTVPAVLYDRLQDRLLELSRFDHQRQRWQGQVAIGQGFSSPMVFPPNVIAPILSPAKIQRCQSPKMSREALPRRAKSASSLFELPSSKPLFISAFTYDAFSDAEHSALPSALALAGTLVDFQSGLVTTGRTLYCPFLVFERCQSTEGEDVENALNKCAVSGAQCVKGLQDIAQRALKRHSDSMFAFSCLLNDEMATINLHTVDQQGDYIMVALYKFELMDDQHFNTFQAWIEAIEDWASKHLLPTLKDFLTKIAHAGDTPPSSPIPSLSLSIDTAVGHLPALMQSLRRGFPTIAWQADEMADSPINSSIAHCGTPADGRKAQNQALSSPTNGATFNNLMVRRGRTQSIVSPVSVRSLHLQYTPAKPSPFSPRYPVNSTTTTPAFMPTSESPCRPGSLSPFTPPPDQPWAAKSPMLVLQKRVDVAMNEVQELRHQVEMLQLEVTMKNEQLSQRLAAMESWQKQCGEILDTREDTADATSSVSRIQRRRGSNTMQDTKTDHDEDLSTSWIALIFPPDSWDLLLERLLFIVAMFALLVMCVILFRDLVLSPGQTFSLLNIKSLWLRVHSRMLLEFSRLSRMQDILPSFDLTHRMAVWKNVE